MKPSEYTICMHNMLIEDECDHNVLIVQLGRNGFIVPTEKYCNQIIYTYCAS